jgi:predicted TPR repeat methyltransferase
VENRIQSARAIASALSLSGDSEELRCHYDRWAATYDEDVTNENYAAPAEMVEILRSLSFGERETDFRDDALLEIIDAGCGTGLLGMQLREVGYRLIDGFDLSGEMVAVAAAKGAYRELKAGVDIEQASEVFGTSRYDIGIACGVFTCGHVSPKGLHGLISLVRPLGLVVVSTRASYCEATCFEGEVRELEASNQMEVLACRRNRPYTSDETAHYWVFKVRAA